MSVSAAAPLLDVANLRVAFAGRPPAAAVDGLDLRIEPAETLALVGESGSGKSATALALMGLLGPPQATVTAGRWRFGAVDLAAATSASFRRLRGRGLGLVFQDPHGALNPYRTVGHHIREALALAGLAGRHALAEATLRALAQVGLTAAGRVARLYPHELSGGMAQRVALALALVPEPALLIADEPTSALDVTVQAQIAALLVRLQRERAFGMLLISHDLGVVAGLADRVLVLYAGRAAEEGPAAAVFAQPAHPYTAQLLAAVPDPRRRSAPRPIAGRPPPPDALPPGCAFAPRCALARTACRAARPALAPVPDAPPGHRVACIAETAELRRLRAEVLPWQTPRS